jgi:hypothetical protein
VKCEYPDLEKPCQNCFIKNLECGHKVYNRDLPVTGRTEVQNGTPVHETLVICRPPSTPDDQFLTSTDVMYMQHYHQDMRTLASAFYWRHGCPNLHCVFRRFGRNLVSKSYRYAALLHASFRVHQEPTGQVLQYLDQFYKHTRQAIESENFVELVYACYTAALYCFLARQYPEFIKHSIGLLLSFKTLTESVSLDVDEKFLMRCMIVNVFEFILAEVERRMGDEDWMETLDLAVKFTQSAAFLLLPQNRLMKGSAAMVNDDHRTFTKSLTFSFQIYLAYYSVIKDTSTDIVNSVLLYTVGFGGSKWESHQLKKISHNWNLKCDCMCGFDQNQSVRRAVAAGN